MSTMRVGIVCPYDWSYPGGVRTHIVGLTNALRKKGIEVQVMAPASNPDTTIYPLGRTVGIPYNGSIARLNFSLSARARIAKRLRKGDIDLLHIHEPFSPSASFLALMQTSLPVVATFHMSRERSLAYSVARPLLEHFERKIDYRIVVSDAARRLIARYLPARPGAETLIPNGIDYERYRDAIPDPDLQSFKPYVLFVGRNEPRKGLNVALKAMKHAREKVEANLVVAGTTTHEVEDVLGEVPGWVRPLGPVGQEQLPSVYAGADVFCAPNLGGESFGMVVVEAMAAGRPVVASDIPGFRDAAGDAAIFSPPDDHEALSAALVSVLSSEQIQDELSQRSSARARRFNWDALIDQVTDIYRSVAGRSNMAAG